jgi:HTH-type transcriptional regulator/antitoxin HigA
MWVRNIHEARLFILMTPSIFIPHTPAEYEQLVELRDRLIDQIGEDETHPLA